MTRSGASRLVVGAAAALAAAAALMRTVLRRRRAATGPPEARRRLRCACGQDYEVRGIDRHRILWRAGAPEGEPVLGESCPVCQAPLPTEQAVAAG